MSDNRREFFRLEFDRLIDGEISIKEETPVSVKIDNVSVGGMGFVSSLEFPMQQTVTCCFRILESSFSIKGSVIYKAPRTNYYEYGVSFDIQQDIASELFKQLNYYHIRQRKKTLQE